MWKIFLTSFGIMLLAEIGDKTQLAVISLAGRFRSPWVVFLGASLAMLLAAAIGIAIGTFLPSVLGERTVRTISGGFFILFGILILAGK
jgi:putative Ca2+/H+ antiporter (TMEM165/GDT1 family)